MKNKIALALISLLLITGTARSDEGMWLLTMLKQLNLEQKGLEISSDQIYSLNQSCIKDAIVGLGTEGRPFRHFCTGQIISDQGLMITNHHCGYGYIQKHSSVDNDYLTDGFWAMTKEEELSNPGLTVSFLVSVEDVTSKILSEVNNTLTPEERTKKIDEIRTKIIEEATKDNKYTANVNSMFEGNQYFLFVYNIYKDVRLVGAPPSSIGKFGGDTDNWMWPRHTADFSVFRVYSAPDGKPAVYDPENIPMKPKYHLPISLKGYKDKDYLMIVGYPGGTDRYLTSFGIEEQVERTLPVRIQARTKILELMKEDMNANDNVRIQYSSKYYRISNGWKYFIGQKRGLKRLQVFEKKQNLEEKVENWINQDQKRKEKYGEAIILIEQAYAERKEINRSITFFREALFSGHELINQASGYASLNKLLSKDNPDQEKINKKVEELKEGIDDFFKDYNVDTDKKIFEAMIEMYAKNVPQDHLPDIYTTIASKYKDDYKKFADKVYSKTIFADKTKLEAFLNNPSAKILSKDMIFQINKSFTTKYRELSNTIPFDKLDKGERLFVGALLDMNKGIAMYPDANSTMRLSFGYVGGYNPADAVTYDFTTTTKGILEKEDPSSEEFIVDAKLKELIQKEEFGPYSNQPDLITCFLGNLDSTGGNSGTAVLNSKGELLGLLFDGNWEAMSGDIYFEDKIQKSINVDIRYVLFIIDKVAGAKHLVDEMTIVETQTIEEAENTSANIEIEVISE